MRVIDQAIEDAELRGDASDAAFLRGLRTPDGGVAVFSVPGMLRVAWREQAIRLSSGDHFITAKPVWGARRFHDLTGRRAAR